MTHPMVNALSKRHRLTSEDIEIIESMVSEPESDVQPFILLYDDGLQPLDETEVTNEEIAAVEYVQERILSDYWKRQTSFELPYDPDSCGS